MPSVGEEVAVDRDDFAVDLVGPTGVVPVALEGEMQVDVEGVIERLSVVKCLQRLSKKRKDFLFFHYLGLGPGTFPRIL